jgi:hypothetical protein
MSSKISYLRRFFLSTMFFLLLSMVLNVVEEIQHWAVLRPAAFFTCQLTQTGMRIQQAHPYPAVAEVQE